LTAGSRFRLNHDAVAGKVIDGEAILINVVTGRYYSLENAGCVAWLYLSAGVPFTETVQAIADRYAVEAGVVITDLRALIDELAAEELLVEAAPEDPRSSPDESALGSPDEVERPYGGLHLLTFRDMEELLAFDPPLPAVPRDFSQATPD
jgi:hypothetical protein